MNTIALQLQYEEWAYRHGYSNETQIALSADFLKGVHYSGINDTENTLSLLPDGLHVSKSVREAFYKAGQELVKLNSSVGEADILHTLKELFKQFRSDLSAAVAEDGILASTGDCRGACAYNVGDRSEYRHHGY